MTSGWSVIGVAESLAAHREEANLVEVVARAMWDAESLQGWDDADQRPGTMITEYDRDVYRRHAKAAVGAIQAALAKECATMTAPSIDPAAPAVAVMGLVWESRPNSRDQFADTPCGQYAVGIVHGAYIATIRLIKDGQWDDEVFARGLCTRKEAKAAAQADYESRIRSAIASLPQGERQ
ncbi:hypothetical protein [Mesorhizobium sp.]|uniref:hypothetical protein n=1 Tax=Mesorhizobium sp. TaxID=1871066 RepID=UPI000FE6AC46|nr:hypothetical protein [Mesorhizobium sp.]RWO20709.1 MAG: hypothetical protein EOS09_26695 [Mesorhizobium sp.]